MAAHEVLMSLELINLRKLLKLMYLDQRALTSELRMDIREERDRERGIPLGGGDFYGPFWRDAKDHVFGLSDLHDTTADRISGNDRRRNLYPRLRDGFLLWWNERRRWTNAPFEPIDTPTTRYRVPGIATTVKIDSVLAVQDGRGDDHYVYPYWFADPAINGEAARVGLWLLSQALPQILPEEIRLLDVIRGQTFSIDRDVLTGEEAAIFAAHFDRLSQRRRQLRDEYDH
jgi:hypothetical protein